PGKELILRFSYDSYLFEHETINRMLQHVDTLLSGVADDADTLVGELPLITEQEQQQVTTAEWNQVFNKLPQDKTVADLFEKQVDLRGEGLACRFNGVDTSYSELNQLANQLANHLVDSGVTPDQPVAICLDRSREMLVGILAILKVGGAYLPIDPSYPEDRVTYMVDNSAAPVLITNNEHSNRFEFLAQTDTQLLNLDAVAGEIDAKDKQFASIRPENGADSLAIIIYTSGSTGKPKGVCLSQLAVERLVLNTNYMTFDSSQRFGHGSNVSFDAATFEFWGAMLNGAALIGIDKDTMLSPPKFAEFVRREKINVQFVTTALFNALSKDVPDVFSGIDCVLFGGEACDPGQVAAVLAQEDCPKHLLHLYGPSENATLSTYYDVKEVLSGANTVPIGYPVANSTLYILDEKQRPVPLGVPGEIYVGGYGVAEGYLNRPDLTAEVFMEDPFSGQPNARMYKTGDLGRLLPGGAAEILGRIDDQVKIRGFRIELGEIEAAVNRLSDIADAVVVVREDQPGNKQLVAYCKLAAPDEADLSLIRGSLKQQLPDYMIPAAFVVVDHLPITPNGKVDKKALPVPSADAYQVSEYVAASNDVEQALADIWQDVLALPQVGIHDDFFDLGGHSLLVTKVSSRIKEKLSIELPLRTLFEVPTIAALAEIIGAVQWQNKPADDSVEEDCDDEEFEEGSI
ncbi:MAG: amino acid adenylation domain-containing protein, partial [Pseudomonadales bacterium]|nr:amino acid adenylation domain-containing protein [Pseudomonadales bacterium]